MDLPPAEQLLASAINCLIQEGHEDTAKLLLFCDAEYEDATGWNNRVYLSLVGPAIVRKSLHVDGIDEDGHAIGLRLEAIRALYAVTPYPFEFEDFFVRVKLIDIQPGWREELLEIAHGRRVHNQGVDIPGGEIVVWGNLRFRSQTEARIARALDASRVLFLPNCLGRLNKGDGRTTKEADFLVCQNGKWGILEVDGPFHPRAADDHERDRLFQQHGIKVTQRFTAEECHSDAPGVVRRFLMLLEKNG